MDKFNFHVTQASIEDQNDPNRPDGYLQIGDYEDKNKDGGFYLLIGYFKEKKSLHLFQFYNNTNIKGLGHKVLCKVLNILKEWYDIDEKSMISLEASGGGQCQNPINIKEAKEYLQKNFPEVIKLLIEDDLYDDDDDYVIQQVCNIIANQKLIKYYESLGFQVIDNDGYSAEMISNIKTVLDKCNVKFK